MRSFPVVLMCTDFHRHIYEHIKFMAEYGTINKEDLDLFLLTDSVEEMQEHIRKYAVEGFKLQRSNRVKPSPLLGEEGI